jgi:hypothetical protein
MGCVEEDLVPRLELLEACGMLYENIFAAEYPLQQVRGYRIYHTYDLAQRNTPIPHGRKINNFSQLSSKGIRMSAYFSKGLVKAPHKYVKRDNRRGS